MAECVAPTGSVVHVWPGATSAPRSAAARWLCAVLLVLLTLAVGAQATAPEAPAPPGPGEAASRRDTARLFLVHRMRETLQLSDAQTLKVLDVLEALDKEREGHQATMASLQDRLRAAVDDPATPDGTFKDLVAEAGKEQARFEGAARGLEDRLLAIFSPRQQAQYLVLRRNLLQQIRQGEAGPPPANRPAGRWRR